MALSPAALNVARQSATDLYRAVHGQKGFEPSVQHNVCGVLVTFHIGFADPLKHEKIGAVRAAIYKVISRGLAMPNQITVYTSGEDGFVNIAFQRDVSGAANASIGLGGKLATPGRLPIGVATVKGGGSTTSYITAVCVHEIGHILHEISNPEFFWGPNANKPTPPALGGQVSMYAGNNIKEFVAEVFTGLIYGERYNDAVMNAYVDYAGPTSASFP